MAHVSISPNAVPARGNLGIGTLLPKEKLHVVGNIQVDSSVFIRGQLQVGNKLVLDSSLNVKGPVNFGRLNLNLSNTNQNGNTTSMGSFKILNLAHVEDAEEGLDYFLKVDENGNVYRSFSGLPVFGEEDFSGLTHAREIKVDLSNAWPDYVFQTTYRLAPLAEVEAFITEHQHLPGFPSAKEIEANEGINLSQTNRLLTVKEEELTLYLIQVEKRIKEFETKIEES